MAQTVTSRGAKGNFFTSFLAGALAVTAAIYVGGNVSGEGLGAGGWAPTGAGHACECGCAAVGRS